MRCPACQSSYLNIRVSFSAQVPCVFDETGRFELLDDIVASSHWSPSSACRCLDCAWSGYVAEAQAGETETDGPDSGEARELPEAITLEQLDGVRQRFHRGRLSASDVQALLEEVERLNAVSKERPAEDC